MDVGVGARVVVMALRWRNVQVLAISREMRNFWRLNIQTVSLREAM